MNLQSVDKVFAAILFCVGLYVLAASWKYGIMNGRVPGAGFFPFFSGLLFTVLSGLLLLRGTWTSGRISGSVLRAIGCIICGLLLFVAVAVHLGFTSSLFVLVLAVGWVCEPEESRNRSFAGRLLLMSLVTCTLCYFFFKYFILIKLPSGITGF